MGGMGGMGGGDSGSAGGLSAQGVDFSNTTQAMNFLGALLDDDEFKIIGNDYARYFWYGVAAAIGVAAIANFIRRLTLHMRLRAAAKGQHQPARPRHPVMLGLATATAMVREATYVQITPVAAKFGFKVPPLGTLMLIVAYFVFIVVLEFANNDVPGAQFWQARGIRAGWLAVAQVPLSILLVMKTNLIGLLTGVTVERLNVLHRWAARITLFCAILHFGYQSYGWQQFGLMQLEWSTDECPPTGIAAFALLLWINIANLIPFRFWSYEIFVCQHILSFFGFIIATMYHLPDTALWSRIYIYIPIALYLLDRIVRTILFSYKNAPSGRATLTALEGGVTKITVTNKRVKNWSPGSYVLLSIPRFGFFETHPATILSTPNSQNGAMTFLLKSHQGFTKRITKGADKPIPSLPTKEATPQPNTTHKAYINGPYGGSHSDLAAFDSVALISGSTGVTFALANLQDLAERAAASPGKIPLRRVRFIWCVRDVKWTSWCAAELSEAHRQLREAGVQVDIDVHVTCADAFTDLREGKKEDGCPCDTTALNNSEACCCVTVDEQESDDVSEESIKPASPKATKDGAAVKVAITPKPVVSLAALPCASFHSGRPDLYQVIGGLLENAEGESAVTVCGPVGLNAQTRNTVVRLSDERAIHKGSPNQGVYLHVEAFS